LNESVSVSVSVSVMVWSSWHYNSLEHLHRY
jgi:hypothetical protein